MNFHLGYIANKMYSFRQIILMHEFYKFLEAVIIPEINAADSVIKLHLRIEICAQNG